VELHTLPSQKASIVRWAWLIVVQALSGIAAVPEFRDSIKNSGGGSGACSQSVEAETQELFDCSTDELYQEIPIPG
jgi:hypothetical protein